MGGRWRCHLCPAPGLGCAPIEALARAQTSPAIGWCQGPLEGGPQPARPRLPDYGLCSLGALGPPLPSSTCLSSHPRHTLSAPTPGQEPLQRDSPLFWLERGIPGTKEERDMEASGRQPLDDCVSGCLWQGGSWTWNFGATLQAANSFISHPPFCFFWV